MNHFNDLKLELMEQRAGKLKVMYAIMGANYVDYEVLEQLALENSALTVAIKALHAAEKEVGA